jgi:prefoldin subunit 1
MSMPNEALQKVCNILLCCCLRETDHVQVLQEIGQKKAFAEQQLVIVRQQKAARTREGRMLQLTSSEVSSLPADTKVYEGVGKMYVSNVPVTMSLSRGRGAPPNMCLSD